MTIRRVRLVRNLMGVLATHSKAVRLENIAAGENRTGIVLAGLENSAVVNCSMVKNSALALSISHTTDCAAFNNLMVRSPLGVFVAENNSNLLLDYNAYMTSLIGKGKDVPIPSVFSWRDLTASTAIPPGLRYDFPMRPASTTVRPARWTGHRIAR